jgi:Protein of unknown function (DUF2281)
MSAKQALAEVAAQLPEERVRELLDFARFLQARQEQEEWRRFAARQFARAYGPNEPDYSEADLKPGLNP